MTNIQPLSNFKGENIRMKPPRRSSRRMSSSTASQPADTFVPSDQKWSLNEKKRLLEGLKRFGPHELEEIQRFYVPQRKISDIKYFFNKMKSKSRALKDLSLPPIKKAPIEVWLAEAENLTHNEHDYSFSLADVFSMFSSLEPHDHLPQGYAPDWNNIYQYMSALLREATPPPVSPSDAMVILDLIESLADDLRNLDTSSQRRLMLMKYKLLSEPTCIADVRTSRFHVRQALEEDLLETPQQATSQLQANKPNRVQTPLGYVSNSPLTPANQSTEYVLSSANPHTPLTPANQSVQHALFSTNQDTPSTSTNQSTEHALFSTNQGTPSTSTNQEEQPSTSTANQNSTPSSSARQGAKTASKRYKKTPLYTLNPFCIPIKRLQLKHAK